MASKKIAERFTFDGSRWELTVADVDLLADVDRDRGAFGNDGDRRFKPYEGWIAAGIVELHVPGLGFDANQERAMQFTKQRKVRLTPKGKRFMAALRQHQADTRDVERRIGPARSEVKSAKAGIKAGKIKLAAPDRITIAYGRQVK